LSRYAIVRRLATGGMAEVLQARDAGGRPVALKRVLPHLAGVAHVVERLRLEARATAALDHPGIVRVIELLDEGPTLVLEHVAGVDARTLRARGRPLPPVVVVAILVQAAEALAHAHARGVVHRDLRAANLLLAWDGAVKLADFGIATLGDDPSADVTALARLAIRLSEPQDEDPPTLRVSSGGLEAPSSPRQRTPALQTAPPPSSITSTAGGGLADVVRADTAAGMALQLERWLHENGIEDPRLPVASLLAELFSEDERRGSITVDDDFGDPTPPLLGR
jgi:serine/threonine protein kinase